MKKTSKPRMDDQSPKWRRKFYTDQAFGEKKNKKKRKENSITNPGQGAPRVPNDEAM